MNVQKNMIERMKKELSQSEFSKRKGLLKAAYEDFDKYFENKNKLLFTLEYDILISEYIFFVKHFKDSIFELYLYDIINMFNKAAEIDKKITIQFMEKWHHNISTAINNLAQISYLERDKTILDRLDLYVKNVFGEIGDVIEGVLKYYIKFLYGFLLIIKNEDNVLEKVEKVTIGTAIEALAIFNEDFKIIYKSCFKDIPLNQWRNISNHSDYQVDVKNNKVIAYYGIRERRHIELTKKELDYIMYGIDAISNLHKIGITIIYIDNSSDINLLNANITEDTIIMHMVEIAFAEEFEITDLKMKSNIFKFEFYDQKHTKDVIIFDKRINSIIAKIDKFITNKIIMVFRADKIERKVVIEPSLNL